MNKGLQSMRHANNLAKWAQKVEACRSSGLTVTQWCLENGITKNTYYKWQKQVFEAVQTEQYQFFEVPVSGPVSKTAVSVEINGITADIMHGADEETVRAVLRAIKSC